MELDRMRGEGIEVVLLLDEGRYAVLEWQEGGRVRRSSRVDVTRGDRDLDILPARWIVKVGDGFAVFETAALHVRSYANTDPRVHRVDLRTGAIESQAGTWHDRKKHFR